MRGKKTWMIAALALVLLGTWSCASGDLDDPDAPASVLEVVTMSNPPVSAQLAGLSCSFTVADWTALMENYPKNQYADAEDVPFNDLVMIDVTVDYSFINTAVTVPSRVIGLGNVVVPLNDSGTVIFAPISFDDLIAGLPGIEGTTANLTLTFRGRSVSGIDVRATAFRQLFIEGCS